MINLKNVKCFCCENISKIQNYEFAINDHTQTWECHHRLGSVLSKQKLIDLNCYYKRPATELIFLTSKQHRQIHRNGEKHPLYGKTGEKHPKSKPVQQIDKNTGEIIKTWPSASEVQKQLGIGHINKCCKGKYKTVGGFVWRYK